MTRAFCFALTLVLSTTALAAPADPWASPPASAPAPAASASRDASGIETVAFYLQTQVGYGGSLMFMPVPMVLFKSGDALLEISALGSATRNPKEWTKWRRAGGALEYLDGAKWRKLGKVFDRVRPGFTLDGTYSHESYAGHSGPNAANGASWNTLAFDRTGHFTTGGGGGMATGGVATRSQRATAGGTYAITGYTLTLRSSDGATVTRTIVIDPNDLGMVWIDGTGYKRR